MWHVADLWKNRPQVVVVNRGSYSALRCRKCVDKAFLLLTGTFLELHGIAVAWLLLSLHVLACIYCCLTLVTGGIQQSQDEVLGFYLMSLELNLRFMTSVGSPQINSSNNAQMIYSIVVSLSAPAKEDTKTAKQ